ncbi:Protein tyrosine phosphatase receptor type C-associated protein [Varanus komodoensis]|uniref:Protein tyrosine phosphatase receptor type C associated protein n=1 Tax=Varanus komodoensis TaxID=61221 RepID=A0A8D2LSD4_VARKO|nr:protein tyrosine phosphatase receptor type C-associated protein [Varanus komodoensis]KAF7241921.1 Protein tyrosine phosphatase receptor type C-associated protein [Varanus komodoensis]
MLAPFFLQALSFPYVLSALLLLLFPGKALADAAGASDGRRGGNHGDDVTVSILVCLLLLLLLMLFLAWQRLSRETAGRYHPRHLMRGLILRWQEFCGEASAEDASQSYRDEELGQQQQDNDMEDEEDEEQQLPQGDSEQEEERQLIPSKSINAELHQDAGVQEPPEEEGASRATEGRAEALLSGLHSFSGTATWEDSGKPLHVTAL